MRKTTILATVLLLAAGSASAVVGYDGSAGDMHIMDSGTSASKTTSVGPNGTKWTAEVSMTGTHAAEDPVGNVGNATYSDDAGKSRVSFTGEIVAPTPCHAIEHRVEKRGDTYVMDIRTVNENSSQICTQVLTSIEYDASFEAEKPYTLEVRHNGDKVETFEHIKAPDMHPDRPGMFAGLINWLSGLF